MTAPAMQLRTSDGTLALGGPGIAPLIMGIVNATPDSFSDAGMNRSLDARVALARQLLADGASLIDIGGESGVTNRPAIDAAKEIERVVPLIARVVELGARVSVDTYKPAVAAAAVAAGASIVNDVSGLRDPELADVCAQTGAALVVMHTIAEPKRRLHDRSLDGLMAGEVSRFLEARIELATGRGVAFEQLLLDPGPDFSKTPAQTIEVLRELPALQAIGRPVLLAVSRKDFIGALTARGPRERLAGTLAAVAYGVGAGAHILRLHDVGAAREFLEVLRALDGSDDVDPGLQVSDALRWASPDGRPSPAS
ncbi:MAG: dihydropteroate synthase [Solirubrobacteraceae bacterium]